MKSGPYISVENITNKGIRFVVNWPDGTREIFLTRGGAEMWIETHKVEEHMRDYEDDEETLDG